MATPIKDNTTALEELLDRARALPSVPGSVEQATPTIAVSSGGLITASATQGAGVVAAGTKSATRQLPTKGATTIEPSDEVQTAVPAGTYVTGDIKVSAQSGGAVRVANGTITLSAPDGYMDTTITCGFQPDFVVITLDQNDGEYEGQAFHDEKQLSACFVGVNTPFAGVATFCEVSNADKYGQRNLMFAGFIDRLQNGFLFSLDVYDESYENVAIKGVTVPYTAYKIT